VIFFIRSLIKYCFFKQLFKQQDVHLDMISDRVSSLKNISQTMHTELESQSQ
jgi:hypothetical protein